MFFLLKYYAECGFYDIIIYVIYILLQNISVKKGERKMKSILFKKTAAAACALSMVGAMGFNPIIANAAELYSQNYENVTDASTVMISQSSQSNVSIGTDRTKYIQFVGAGENSRSSYSNFEVDLSKKAEYIVEFDASFTPSNKDASQFVLKTGSIPAANLSYTSDYLFKLQENGNSTTWTINDVATTTVNLGSGKWYHYKLYADVAKELLSVTITDDNGTKIADKVIVPTNGNIKTLKGIYLLNGRYYAKNKIDNILVRDVADGDEFGELQAEQLSEINFTEGTAKIPQPAEGTSVDYKYTISAVGNYGGDLSDKATYEWSYAGLDKEDGYVTITPDKNTCTINVRNGVSNYYVPLTCKVTYGETTLEKTYPLAIIGANASNEAQLIPETGYPVDMNEYGDSLVGYYGTSNELTSKDIILNNWSIYGSNGSRTMQLVKDEDGTKSIMFASNGGGGSTVANYQWPAQTSQYIMKIRAKVSDGTTFGVYSNTPNNVNAVAEFSFSCNSGALNAGTETISGVDAGKWYEFVVSVDPSVGTYTVAVNDAEGNKVGETAEVATGVAGMKYFSIAGAFPVYLQSLYAYKPKLSTIAVNSSADVVKVPEAGEAAATVDLSAALADAEGVKVTGAVEWSLAEEYANVELTSTGAQTATLKVNEGASGEITVVATKDGKQAEKKIQLTTSSNVVAFSKSTSSITIPFMGQDAVTADFEAETRDGSGAPITGGTITYALLAKDGVTETTVKGVTFENGKMTVAPGASPAIVYVKATNEDGLSAKVKVNIHGLTFAFGSQEPAEGYTQVADTLYTEKQGYGFADTAAVTVGEANVTGAADYRFKANVPNGNYVVDVVTTSTTMKSEVVEAVSATTGISKSGSRFNVAVCDGVLDLTFLKDSTLSTLSVSQAPSKSALDKPKVYAIGDSTTNNNANGAMSWGNCVANGKVAVPEVFSGFSNNGMAGRDSVNFYNQGRVEAVLLNVCPGDYVTVNMGINSKEANEGASFYTLIKDYYVQGIIQRGGIPVIVTATPDGVGFSNSQSTYDEATGKFDVDRTNGARNPELRKVAEELNLNVIELGQHFEDYFNSLTMDDVNAYNTENGTSYTSVYDLVKSWYPDHNHYYEPLGVKIGTYILGEVAKLVPEDKPVQPEAVVSAPKVYTKDGTDEAVSYTTSIKANDITVTKLNWTVTVGDNIKSDSKAVQISGGSDVTYGFVIVLQSEEAKAAGTDAVSLDVTLN